MIQINIVSDSALSITTIQIFYSEHVINRSQERIKVGDYMRFRRLVTHVIVS